MRISLKSLGGNLPFIDLGRVKVSISLKSLGGGSLPLTDLGRVEVSISLKSLRGGSLSLIDLGRAFTDD